MLIWNTDTETENSGAGYYVDTVGKNKKAIAEYIRNQLQENLAYEQMSIKELVDPFTGEPVKKSKK